MHLSDLRPALVFRFLLILLFLNLIACSEKQAEDPLNRIPDPKTLNESYVSNPDNILSASAVAGLNSRLSPLDQAGLAHIDVAVVKSAGDMIPKETAHALFRKWKIGDAEKDNGLLILLVIDQRRIEFETGYGLEGPLPDVICKRIQQRDMVPLLKQGKYDEAVTRGVEAVINQVENEGKPAATADSTQADTALPVAPLPPAYAVPEPPAADDMTAIPAEPPYEAREPAFFSQDAGLGTLVTGSILYLIFAGLLLIRISANNAGSGGLYKILIFIPLIFINVTILFGVIRWSVWAALLAYYLALAICTNIYFLVITAGMRTTAADRHARYIYLNRKIHGLDWTVYIFPLPLLILLWPLLKNRLRKYRHAPYICRHCRNLMTRMDEEQDDTALNAAQQKEESLLSVDYDVWQCAPCGERLVLSYENLDSKAKTCDTCKAKTLQFKTRKVVKRATKSAGGWGWATYSCANCGAEQQEKFTIARIQESSGSSSSSSSSSSWSSSGSSRSSSSSSGGSSGGGGAGSSW
ncbi:YgcG family protein [Pedobacter sp. SYP-B3415]|uniref:TPM domain-containing protein n=1 Tax=Pedobacter sp. SYP-B3415 TaxID=2496641 RepID=UPI00101C803B|nr:TPM domain-containing protein [Pedobacter sp. SYP-B3415]